MLRAWIQKSWVPPPGFWISPLLSILKCKTVPEGLAVPGESSCSVREEQDMRCGITRGLSLWTFAQVDAKLERQARFRRVWSTSDRATSAFRESPIAAEPAGAANISRGRTICCLRLIESFRCGICTRSTRGCSCLSETQISDLRYGILSTKLYGSYCKQKKSRIQIRSQPTSIIFLLFFTLDCLQLVIPLALIEIT